MIIDCCSYNGELEALKVRLRELFDFVDVFLMVECPYTFSGLKKDLKFPIHKELIDKKYLEKIKYVVYNQNNAGDGCWERERKQKNSIFFSGLASLNLKNNDYIIYSDLDEIANPKDIKILIDKDVDCIRFCPHWFNFNINNYLGGWQHYSIWLYKYKLIKKFMETGKNIRHLEGLKYDKLSGWHLSYFFPPEQILQKLKSYSHYNDVRDKKVIVQGVSHIKHLIDRGGEIFGAATKREFNSILPKYYRNNKHIEIAHSNPQKKLSIWD